MKTYLDSGVLLHIWRGSSLAAAGLQIMADDSRVFLTSQMVRLELLPKPRYEGQNLEVEFYERKREQNGARGADGALKGLKRGKKR